jgi:hypothetical protein
VLVGRVRVRPADDAVRIQPELTAGYIETLAREDSRTLLGELRHYEINSTFLLGEQWIMELG